MNSSEYREQDEREDELLPSQEDLLPEASESDWAENEADDQALSQEGSEASGETAESGEGELREGSASEWADEGQTADSVSPDIDAETASDSTNDPSDSHADAPPDVWETEDNGEASEPLDDQSAQSDDDAADGVDDQAPPSDKSVEANEVDQQADVDLPEPSATDWSEGEQEATPVTSSMEPRTAPEFRDGEHETEAKPVDAGGAGEQLAEPKHDVADQPLDEFAQPERLLAAESDLGDREPGAADSVDQDAAERSAAEDQSGDVRASSRSELKSSHERLAETGEGRPQGEAAIEQQWDPEGARLDASDAPEVSDLPHRFPEDVVHAIQSTLESLDRDALTERDVTEGVGRKVVEAIETHGDTAAAKEQLEAASARRDIAEARHDSAAEELTRAGDSPDPLLVESVDAAESLVRGASELEEEARSSLDESRRRDATELLERLRPGEGSIDKGVCELDADAVDREVARFPADWIEQSNSRGELHVRELPSDRDYDGGYMDQADGSGVIEVAPGADATLLHELGHRMVASDPELMRLQEEFFNRRTAGHDSFTAGGAEYVEDEWVNPYTGRRYPDGDNEVYSTGLEGVFHGRDDLWMRDPDMTRFVLGTLAAR